jgi:hypothetical protein
VSGIDLQACPSIRRRIRGQRGDTDRAFEWLEKALEARSWELPVLKGNPIFNALRADSRFPALLARLGLPR